MATEQSQAMVQFQKIQQTLELSREKIIREAAGQLDAERQLNLALQIVRSDGKLLKCSPGEILKGVMEATRKRLSLNPALEHVHLIPFYSKKDKRYRCGVIDGYKGLIHLMCKYGGVHHITPEVVYAHDKFKINLATGEISHEPYLGEGNPGEIVAAYARAVFKDGGPEKVAFLRRFELDQIRKSSRAAEESFWTNWTGEMCKKSAVRRLYKMMDVSEELADAASESKELPFAGEDVIDVEVVKEEPDELPKKSAKKESKPEGKTYKLKKPSDRPEPPPPGDLESKQASAPEKESEDGTLDAWTEEFEDI